MKKVLSALLLLSVLSCGSKIEEEDDNTMDYLAAYTGYVTTIAEPLPQGFTPNLFFGLGLFTNNKCLVDVGISESSHTEIDKLSLLFKVTDSGLVLYDKNTKKTRFTVKGLKMNHNMNPEMDLDLYLGETIKVEWNFSPGKVWDKYSGAAKWPNSLVLTLVDTEIVD